MTVSSAVGCARSAASRSARVCATVAAAGSVRCVRERQGSRLAWCSTSRHNTGPGTAVASRFSASVVLRVNTTTSPSGRNPTNSPTHSRARSSSAVLTCERWPAPRCTLDSSGRTSATCAATGSRAGALAARSRLAYSAVPPVTSGTRVPAPTGRGRDVAGRSRVSVIVSGSFRNGDPASDGSALAVGGAATAGSSPGAPHRGGGLPASEPGLGAGAHDLRGTVGGPRRGRQAGGAVATSGRVPPAWRTSWHAAPTACGSSPSRK